MIILFIIFLATSFIIALISMKDFDIPKEIKTFFKIKPVKGTIIFFKNKTTHYRG
ncbi:hypothetical protein GYA28_03110 [Candidatus Roizmanbacteria bacterium]|jgi:hypothetical protein|nr:hypothetical protein [Candidatus Roizmanbacteria bacterium]